MSITTDLEDILKQVEDLEGEYEELEQRVTKYYARLEEAADILANLNIITNTPYGKRKWIEGE